MSGGRGAGRGEGIAYLVAGLGEVAGDLLVDVVDVLVLILGPAVGGLHCGGRADPRRWTRQQ